MRVFVDTDVLLDVLGKREPFWPQSARLWNLAESGPRYCAHLCHQLQQLLAVEFVVDLLAQGWTYDEVLDNYPGLTLQDILACVAFASETLHAERIGRNRSSADPVRFLCRSQLLLAISAEGRPFPLPLTRQVACGSRLLHSLLVVLRYAARIAMGQTSRQVRLLRRPGLPLDLEPPRGGLGSSQSGEPLSREKAGGYTSGMKTAVSIPDEVFAEAERLARRTKKSRSQLFSEALKEYVARHAPEEVTEAMNRVCDELGKPADEVVSFAARRVLERSEW